METLNIKTPLLRIFANYERKNYTAEYPKIVLLFENYVIPQVWEFCSQLATDRQVIK
jgi:hypothetical protein